MCSRNGTGWIAQVLELLTLPLCCVVFEEIYLKKAGGWCKSPPENCNCETVLDLWVIGYVLQSGQVSLKSVRWHVSPLPGPLVDMLLKWTKFNVKHHSEIENRLDKQKLFLGLEPEPMLGNEMWKMNWSTWHDLARAKEKCLGPRQDSCPLPPEHRAGALSSELRQLMESKVI